MAKCCFVGCDNPGRIEFHSYDYFGPKGFLICFPCMREKDMQTIKSELSALPHVSGDVISGELVDGELCFNDWEDDMFSD